MTHAFASASIGDKTTVAVVPMDTRRRYCHGSRQSTGPFPPKYWLVPTGKFSNHDTRCGHCQNVLHMHDGSILNTYFNINCNSASDPTLTTMKYGGFAVSSTLLNNIDVPLYLDPENRHKTTSGVGIFIVPTQTEFQIVIDVAEHGAQFNTFTINDAMAGDEKIVINSGRKLYYDGGRAVIRGFNTGSERSFLFVAPSEWEKKNEPEARVAATLSESNIFTIELQPYTRKAKEELGRLSGFGGYYGGAAGASKLGGSRDASQSYTFGGQSPMRQTAHAYGHSKTGFGSSNASFGSMHVTNDGDFFSKPGSTPTGFGFTNPAVGGATVSGGTHIDHVQTQAAVDNYIKCGPPLRIKIQLVCRQSDEHRKIDNLRARLQQDGLDHWMHAAKTNFAKRQQLELELDHVQTRLKRQIDEAHDEWSHAVKMTSEVTGRNRSLMEQLPAHAISDTLLDYRPTEQVKIDNAAREEEKKKAMLLDV